MVDFQTWVDGEDCYFWLAFLKVYLESEHSVCLSIQRAWSGVLGFLVELNMGREQVGWAHSLQK